MLVSAGLFFRFVCHDHVFHVYHNKQRVWSLLNASDFFLKVCSQNQCVELEKAYRNTNCSAKCPGHGVSTAQHCSVWFSLVWMVCLLLLHSARPLITSDNQIIFSLFVRCAITEVSVCVSLGGFLPTAIQRIQLLRLLL